MLEENKKEIRCAIYTRKSTNEGLEQDFNSLDAQREATEFYIRAMKHEGWVLLPEHYDDGGFTGANIDRPALKQLLSDIDAGKIDCVVVYKVDRLSRSLLDFARLLDLFDKKQVSFVSTTQQFNTNDAMGRLTLNILLSFAQFEREMISDRTRDKMSAARKKGKWLGSAPPFGYQGDRLQMRLVPHPDEAEKVRKIFQFYLTLGSASAVAEHIAALGWARADRKTQRGKIIPGGQLDLGRVHWILRNPIYIGKVLHHGKIYEGEHEAIVDEALFNQVQQKLNTKACGRGSRQRADSKFLLQGLIHCEACGHLFTSSVGRGSSYAKDGKEYRYYVCTERNKSKGRTCNQPRIVAEIIEELVVKQLIEYCSNQESGERLVTQIRDARSAAIAPLIRESAETGRKLNALHAEARRLLETFGEGKQNAIVAERIGEIEKDINALNAQKTKADDKLAKMQGLMQRKDLSAVIREGFGEGWKKLNLQEQKKIARMLIERIDLNTEEGRLRVHFADLNDKVQLGDFLMFGIESMGSCEKEVRP